jgi:hypothetical protein
MNKNRKKGAVAIITDDYAHSDRSFDLAFWSRESDTKKFKAAWDLVVFAWQLKGRNLNELRLQRTVAVLKREPS